MPDPSRQQYISGFFDDIEPEAKKGTPAADSTEAASSSGAMMGVVPAASATGEIDATPPNLQGKTVYVIDAHSLIYQVFHALPEMSSPKGLPVGAVFGFTRDIYSLLDNRHPDYLFCAFDHPGDTFRHELYTEYKGDRPDMPEELRPQIGMVQQVLAAMGVAVISLPRYEADDVLATLAHQTEKLGGECFLVTADKDVRQLISDRVRILNMRKNQIYDATALAADWGVRPDQVVDFQALVGDKVDGVPGVPLIGPKNAQELLAKYGTLENLYTHLSELPKSKRKENLETFRDQAFLCQKLVRLDTDVPTEIDWNSARPGRENPQALVALFREFGFRSLAARAAALLGEGAMSVSASAGDTPSAAATNWNSDYRTVTSLDELRGLAAEMANQAIISLDTETTHIHPRWAELVGLSFSWQPGIAWYVPVRAPSGDVQLPEREVIEILRPVLENATVGKLGQNLKYDLIVLRGAGVQVQGVAFDTMVADYLLAAGERAHNLDELARRHLGHENITIESLIGKGKDQKRMDEAPVAQITQYAAEDADVALRLANKLRDDLAHQALTNLNTDVEVPLIQVLAEMEFQGIRVDVARLAELSAEFAKRMQSLEQEIFELAGRTFNIASPKQLAGVLFDELKLPIAKKTKTGPSTDAEVLESLAPLHPLPAKVVEHRQFAKLKGTYVDALPELVHPKTGRVHTSFNQVVAATGRLSSNDPNLQNIPIRSTAGRDIRSAFLPGEPDWLLLGADYSQIELRVLAHFSGDATLCESFAQDEDIHARVASEVYGVPLASVSTSQRRSAKAVNFGIIYGQSAFGLAKSLNIPQSEATTFIEAYFAKYPGVDAFFEKVLAECESRGYVSTFLGRRRAILGVRSLGPSPSSKRGDSRQRNLAERTAINTVIQGSAADLIKLAMLRVHGQLSREFPRVRMLLQIHDELLFEVPKEEAAALGDFVKKHMSQAASLTVPLKVDVKTGRNWAECEG